MSIRRPQLRTSIFTSIFNAMKTIFFSRLLLALCLLFVSAGAQAQAPAKALPGYWNIETNLSTRDYSIVRFYNGQDELVYEERLQNFCLDMRRNCPGSRRISRQLSVALQQVLSQPNAARNNDLLTQQLDQNRRIKRLYAAL